MKITRNQLLTCSLTLLAFIAGYAISNYTNDGSTQTSKIDNKKYEAIIFDMDGTIIDTDHLWKSSNGPILDSHAPHLSQEEKDAITKEFKTLNIYEVWNCVHGHCSVEITPEQIIDENMKHLLVTYKTHGVSYIPHFHEFHEKVTNSGLKTAIASNSQQHIVDVLVEIVPLRSHFAEHIYNADHVNRVYKPQPDVYLHAAQKLGVDPQRCIAIEDSGSGIKAAKAAGMYCIGINTAKNLKALAQADEIVECFSEIDLEKLLNVSN